MSFMLSVLCESVLKNRATVLSTEGNCLRREFYL